MGLFKDILNVMIIAMKSNLGPDVLTIPSTIGNSMLFSNSTIITHDRLSTIIKINLLGQQVPRNFVSIIDDEIKRYGLDCIMDVHFTLNKFDYSEKARKDINVNISGWDRVSKKEDGKSKQDALWGLESAKTLLSDTSFKGTMELKLYASDGITLRKAVTIVKQCINKSGSLGFSATFSLKQRLQEILLTSLKPNGGQDFPMLASTVAEVGPEPLIRSTKGTVFGKNIYTNEPYTIDFTKETLARNILVIAPSGSGKTYMMYNICQNILENGSRAAFTDIKGNEYVTLTKSVGGYVVDLSDKSNCYIDSVKRIPFEGDTVKYFNDMDILLHDILLTLAGDSANENISNLITNFITAMWVQLGVTADNTNTWANTETLDMHIVYDMLSQYCYKQTDANQEILNAVDSMGKYLLRNGEFSYVWRDPINMNKILESPAISFSFGILTGKVTNEVLFKLRWKFMDSIMSNYFYNNYKNGFRTLNIMEEAQIVDSSVMGMYCRHWTLGRSLKQDNIFIANSFGSIKEREDAKPIIENSTILVTSAMPEKTKIEFIKTFGLDAFSNMIDDLEKPNNKYSFFIYPRSKSVPPAVIQSLTDGRVLTVSIPT